MARQSKMSPTLKTIAIVGDGETEYFYFQDFKETEKLSVIIKPDLPTKSGWEGVIEKAGKLISTGTDKVFCVIDYDVIVSKNAQSKYKVAKIKCLNAAKKLSGEVIFIEIMPCLELWFYLHFKLTTKSLNECTLIHNDLKQQCIFDYDKTQKYHQNKKIYSFLIDKLPTAIEHAKKLCLLKSEEEHKTNPCFPFSEMHIIFHELLSEERKQELKLK